MFEMINKERRSIRLLTGRWVGDNTGQRPSKFVPPEPNSSDMPVARTNGARNVRGARALQAERMAGHAARRALRLM